MRSETLAVEDFLRKGLFEIPDYQRNYSWSTGNVDELIDDLLYLPDESDHFLGNIIVDEHDDRFTAGAGNRLRVFDVVDGQQRLITILMLLKAAAEHDDGIAAGLTAENILFPVESRPRLIPLGDDELFFRDHIMADAHSSVETSTPSQIKMREAYRHLDDRMSELAVEGQLADVVDRLRYETRINSIELTDDFEAAVIFEGLNNRGLDLSDLDKTKSFLMYMHQRTGGREDDDRIRDWFGRVYRHLFVLENGDDSVSSFDEESFLQFHHGIYFGYDSDMYTNPFDDLRNRLQSDYRSGNAADVRETTIDYAKELLLAAEAFENIFRPEQRDGPVQDALQPVLSLGRLANVLPVMLAAVMTYDDEDRVARIIDLCEVLAFRLYAIDRRRSDTGLSKLVSLAQDIRHGNDSFAQIESDLIRIIRNYTDDDRFRRKLRDPEFYDNKASQDIRYLLYHYGKELDVDISEESHDDLEKILTSEFTVEHILASELDDEDIPTEIQEEFDEHVDRLGNLTIASRSWNSKFGNLPFKDKKRSPSQDEPGYASSNLRVQRVLADLPQFGKNELESREDDIVDFAVDRWDLPGDDSSSS